MSQNIHNIGLHASVSSTSTTTTTTTTYLPCNCKIMEMMELDI